jgi:hypothetical protein
MTLIWMGGLATALGFACGRAAAPPPTGPTLPEAGTDADDATGLLANLSTRGSDLLKVPGEAGGDAYGGDPYGGEYAHYDDYHYDQYDNGGFGGGTYGGAMYSGYVPPTPDYYGSHAPAPKAFVDGYVETTVTDGGAIEGRVLWPARPRAPATVETAECGTIENRSLRTSSSGEVAGAVVFLADIREGRSSREAGSEAPVRVGGVVERRGCSMRPHLQLAQPIGASLEIINGDADRVQVRGRIWTGASRDVMFDETLSYRGASRSVRLDRPGFVRVRGDQDVDSAWVAVAGHPYYALTDERGRFRLDDIPPGTYTLRVWHEPVVTGVDRAGRAVLTAPTTTEKKVVVKALKTTRTNLNLPRPE